MTRIVDSVKELNSGILELNEGGNIYIYQPQFDHRSINKLFAAFCLEKLSTNECIKNKFYFDSYDWFPSAISIMYWHFFWTFIKYEGLINAWLEGKIVFKDIGDGTFYDLITKFGYKKTKKEINLFGIVQFALFKIINVRNLILIKLMRNKSHIFLRESSTDFRSEEIIRDFPKSECVTLLRIHYNEVLKYFFSAQYLLITGTSKIQWTKFDSLKLNSSASKVNFYAFEYLKQIISNNIFIYSSFSRIFSSKYLFKLISMDDCNYAYPFIYAAKKNNILTYGIQHARYTKNLEQYVMRYVEKYDWFDYLVVWGEFWKAIFLSYNKSVNSLRILVASNKIKYYYDQNKTKNENNRKTRSVLIPYEFIADNIEVAKYISKFIDRDYDVYIKVRPDEPISRQLNSYLLPEHYLSKLKIINKVDKNIMNEVDIIAGTLSTLLYDLLIYRKKTFILKTNIDMLPEMVDFGLATNLNLENFDDFIDSSDYTGGGVDLMKIFGSVEINKVIKESGADE